MHLGNCPLLKVTEANLRHIWQPFLKQFYYGNVHVYDILCNWKQTIKTLRKLSTEISI